MVLPVSNIRANRGQLADKGIPTNPRKITKDKYNLLLQSLEKSNLTQIRPLDVIEHEGKYIVLSGNQRLRALKELKVKEVPCNVLKNEGVEGDILFDELHMFSSMDSNSFEYQAAGLAVLVYLFEKCEVFEH
jgi:hypothetical protein